MNFKLPNLATKLVRHRTRRLAASHRHFIVEVAVLNSNSEVSGVSVQVSVQPLAAKVYSDQG